MILKAELMVLRQGTSLLRNPAAVLQRAGSFDWRDAGQEHQSRRDTTDLGPTPVLVFRKIVIIAEKLCHADADSYYCVHCEQDVIIAIQRSQSAADWAFWAWAYLLVFGTNMAWEYCCSSVASSQKRDRSNVVSGPDRVMGW